MIRSPARVLVVDDEAQVTEMLRVAVTSFGYVVHTAATADEGLRALSAFRPDAVLLDLALVGASGEVLLEYIRATEPTLPVIIVTGNTDEAVANRLLARGAFDYIVKPVDLVRLSRILHAALQRRGDA
jgi:DNA-binding response OmpR family regulator